MSEYGVTPYGFRPKPFEVILKEIEEDFRQKIHPKLNFAQPSVAGQLTGIMASKTRELWELAADVYHSLDPDAAEGRSLTALASLTGTVRQVQESDEDLRKRRLLDLRAPGVCTLEELGSVFDQLRQMVEQAAGQVLDTLGKLVGQKRLGMQDADFKLWIRTRILLNRSRGTGRDLKELLNVLLEQSVNLVEHPDVAFTVQLERPCPFEPQLVFKIIQQAKPLGVAARLWLPPEGAPFQLDTASWEAKWSELLA